MGGCQKGFSDTLEHDPFKTYKLAIVPVADVLSRQLEARRSEEYHKSEVNITANNTVLTSTVYTLMTLLPRASGAARESCFKEVNSVMVVIDGESVSDYQELNELVAPEFEGILSHYSIPSSDVKLVIKSPAKQACTMGVPLKGWAERHHFQITYVESLEDLDKEIAGMFTDLIERGVDPKSRQYDHEYQDIYESNLGRSYQQAQSLMTPAKEEKNRRSLFEDDPYKDIHKQTAKNEKQVRESMQILNRQL